MCVLGAALPSNGTLVLVDSLYSVINRLVPAIKSINAGGALALFLMMALAFFDVLFRYFLNSPISGAKDLTELLMILVVFCSVAYTQVQKGHVGIDLLVDKFPKNWGIVIRVITYMLSIGVFALVSWRTFVEALLFKQRHIVSMELEIPIYPFFFVISLGCIVLTVVLIRDLLFSVGQALRSDLKLHQWATLLSLFFLLLGGGTLWVLQSAVSLDPVTTGFLGVCLFVFLLCFGVPIGFVLVFVAFLGLSSMRGLDASFGMIGTVLFRNTGSYDWSVFPLFVLMGYLCFYLDISRDLYDSAYKIFGRLPGGLAIATIGACTAFGAISGDNGAGAATMAVVARPELKKHRYDERLALGSICAGGTLEFLIPPSIGMILYGVLAEQSIGDLFIAGVVPGLVCAGLFSLYIYGVCRRNPELGPRGPQVKLWEKVRSLKNTWPVILLFMIVIGGLYGGIFTPTEAGGVGASVALIIGLVMGRLTFKKLFTALIETGRISAMVFVILGGAVLFSYFLTASKFTLTLAQLVAGFQVHSIVVVLWVLLLFLVLGFFMPGSAILLITIPIFLPLIKTLGYDLIWFGVLCVMMQNVGACTPPFGFVVFAVKGAAPDVQLSEIYKGVMPFVGLMLLLVVLTIVFPGIATWLPYALKG